jgi:hypothetical protein
MRRGQAALEFLTTYGWAFLVILVMIGALAYFGVLNPRGLLPGRCTFSPEIDCLEYNIDSTTNPQTINFRFRNNVGSTADFNFTNATYLAGTNPSVACSNIAALGAGRIATVKCNFTSGTFAPGDKAKFDMSVLYKRSDGVYWVPVKGEIYGTVQ